MAYLVTGATGFIGRFLVERLLASARATSTSWCAPVREAKLDALDERWAGARPHQAGASGDLGRAEAGHRPRGWIARTGRIDHVFHLAAIYDMTAGEERNESPTYGGTRHAVEVANALAGGPPAPRVLGRRRRASTRARSPRTCSTRASRSTTPTTARSSSPSRSPREESRSRGASTGRRSSSGHSQTGEMDKIDGPYYFFNATAARGQAAGLPAAARPPARRDQHRAGGLRRRRDRPPRPQPGLDGRAFHLVSPEPQHDGRRAQLVRACRRRATAARRAPAATRSTCAEGARRARPAAADVGIPPEVVDYAASPRASTRAADAGGARRVGNRRPAARRLRARCSGSTGHGSPTALNGHPPRARVAERPT